MSIPYNIPNIFFLVLYYVQITKPTRTFHGTAGSIRKNTIRLGILYMQEGTPLPFGAGKTASLQLKAFEMDHLSPSTMPRWNDPDVIYIIFFVNKRT